VARAPSDATAVAFSPAYEQTYRRYLVTETALGALVLVAIYFMVAKP
jgi:hypothetical protein